MTDSKAAPILMPSNGFFITGTDTDCGKTHATAALIAHIGRSGASVAGIKPIASGFEFIDGEWRNQDIDAVSRVSTVTLPSNLINRYSYKDPIAPHIAAHLAGESIDIAAIVGDVAKASEFADIVVVEGVGGWLVPLDVSGKISIESLAVSLSLPVILVVGLRLGCLNHALLSIQAIKGSGVEFVGWVANHVDPDFQNVAENIETLKRLIPEPLLFELDHCPDTHSPVALNKLDLDFDAALALL